jgi:hypothetical protein
LGWIKETEISISNMLNCKIGQLPMKYLGFHINDSRVSMGMHRGMVEKMRRRLQLWKSKNLSYGGQLILTNSSLSSLPIYMMSMFQLHEGVHHQMDKIRANFFWGSDGTKFKYHMVRWENSCLPKDLGGGGAGIINIRRLNEALLLKWIWRIYNQEGDVCCQSLTKKYLRNNPLARCKNGRGRNFGRE